MTEKTIFDFETYKSYLLSKVGSYRQRKGQRSLLAKAIGCQPTFVTQVLNGDFHFSLEQAEKLNRFLDHTEEECDFFFLLIQQDRAGTKGLESYFTKKIERIRSDRRVLTRRLGKESVLSVEHQNVYYSSWHYAAIHIAVALPELNTREKIAQFFRIPTKKISEVLEFLVSVGLVTKEGTQYAIGKSNIRLGNESPNIIRHHSNWRLQAIESLDRETELDLHYSGILCLNSEDRDKVKNRIFEALKDHLAISDKSAAEEICCYNIDFFSLRK